MTYIISKEMIEQAWYLPQSSMINSQCIVFCYCPFNNNLFLPYHVPRTVLGSGLGSITEQDPRAPNLVGLDSTENWQSLS